MCIRDSLTCLCYNKAEIDEFTRQLSYEGIENILALRGDRNPNVPAKEDFLHASDLIKYIKETTGDQFCIAGACYPDIHPEAADKVDDIKNLKKKVDAGAELLLSQLFFDNDTFFNFAEDCRLAGINVPVIPGIMPCINAAQIQRMVTMCGAKFPEKFQKIVHRYGEMCIRDRSQVSGYDEDVEALESQLSEIDSLLSDFNHEISGYISQAEFDEETFYETQKRLDEINPVSYTHLDVYKRQEYLYHGEGEAH